MNEIINKGDDYMPQLTVRGVDKNIIKEASVRLVKELAELIHCNEDSFTIDLIETSSFFKGETVATYPFVQVGWFDRGKEVQDSFASIITNILSDHGILDLEIVFTIFKKDSYYSNGESFE